MIIPWDLFTPRAGVQVKQLVLLAFPLVAERLESQNLPGWDHWTLIYQPMDPGPTMESEREMRWPEKSVTITLSIHDYSPF